MAELPRRKVVFHVPNHSAEENMGKTLAAATFAIATLAATSVFAQQAQQDQKEQKPEQQAAAQSQLPAGAQSIIGKKAMGQDGKEVGEIENVVVSEQGKVEALVISRGGMTGKDVAVKWDSVRMQGDQVAIQMTEQQLSELPEYKSEK
jgi:sporulation protein YlmC with PRC-barrel domain